MSDFLPPISIKGVVFEDGKVWLRQNEFGKWELPGAASSLASSPSRTAELSHWQHRTKFVLFESR
jgi:hypothetical protein